MKDTRAKDLADVTALVKGTNMDQSFAEKLHSDVRGLFLKVVEGIEEDEKQLE